MINRMFSELRPMARMSEWVERFNFDVELAQGNPSDTIYRVKDIFTTRDGSWDVSNKPGSLPQWARDTYLKPMTHPQYFDDAGADHHLFGAVLEDGNLRPWGTIHYYTHTDNQNHYDVVYFHGWANNVNFASYSPERGERGPWAWYPKNGGKADIVKGGGMPNNVHISWFVVWEKVTLAGPVTPPVVTPPVLTLAERVAANERDIAELKAWRQTMEGD